MRCVNYGMKFSFLLLIVLCLTITRGYGQSAINGTVINAFGQPVPDASILLLQSKDSSLVKGSLTAKNGQYNFIDIPAGSYMISSSFTGYKSLYSPVFRLDGSRKEIAIAALQFTENEKELVEVTVTAKKPLFEQKIDRMVVNVASSITSAGSTALEVLQRSPGIIVDFQNNTLSMNGKNGVVIMINGKISRMPVSAVMQMLQGMPSSNIEKIELITTPPANFDAEGNAGFINIVLKTNTQYGTNGSFSITAGYGKGWISSASINFNHRKGRVNIYGDYSFSRRESEQVFKFYRKVINQGNSIESSIRTDREPIVTNFDGRLGIDYELNKKTVIGALVTGYDNKWDMTAQNKSNIFLNGALDTIVTIQNDELHRLINYAANVNLLHNFSGDEKVTMNLDYVYYKDRNPVSYLNSYFDGDGGFLKNEATRSNKTTPIKFWTGAVDYSKKLSPKVEMEAGVKATISQFINDVSVERQDQGNWIKDPDLTARYKLNERIGAAYASFTIAFNEKTNAKMGLRYEYTNSNLGSEAVKDIVDRKYGSLFPSFFISRTFNENNSANFSYSRRITRPTFNDMAPFVIFMDPNTFFSGNPGLQPSFSDAVKVDYLYKKFIFSVSYTYEDNPITRFSPRIDSVTNKQTLAAENQRSQHLVSLNLSLPLQLTKWWNMQNNLSGMWQQVNAIYIGTPLQIRQKSFNVSSVQTFSLPKEFSIELNGFYQSGGLFGLYKLNDFILADLGMQKKLGPKHGTLRFNISNVIGAPSFSLNAIVPEHNLDVRGSLQLYNTTFRLTYTRNFGNQKVKQNRNRSVGSQQEQQRVNANN
jgi:hypothetical protein